MEDTSNLSRGGVSTVQPDVARDCYLTTRQSAIRQAQSSTEAHSKSGPEQGRRASASSSRTIGEGRRLGFFLLLLLLFFCDGLRCVWTLKLIGTAKERYEEQKQTDLFNYSHVALQNPTLDPFRLKGLSPAPPSRKFREFVLWRHADRSRCSAGTKRISTRRLRAAAMRLSIARE